MAIEVPLNFEVCIGRYLDNGVIQITILTEQATNLGCLWKPNGIEESLLI